MFLFSKKKKPSEDSIKRLEYQLCLVSLYFLLGGGGVGHILLSQCTASNLNTHVLDLHENKLTSLPDDIGQLLSLQVLNVEKNHIKQLPDSIGDLRHLQTLNVKGNSLTVIPVSVGRMSSLRTLDISENSITELPKELANVRTLESLILDAQVMRYPPASVCTAGTEEVQRYLCSEMGLEYCPPSQYLLPVLEDDGGKQEVDCVDGEEMAWQSKFMDYEKRKVQKHLEKVIFEKDLEEKQREHTQLLLLNNSRKEDVLLSVKLEQQRLELGVSQQQRAQETERQKMLDKARLAESNIMSRISDLLLDNKRLDYMDRKFDQVLSLQQLDKSKAISQILQEIKLIEAELMQLTKLEVKRRNLDTENLQEVLADQRTALSDILQQLLKQKDQREEELRMVLVEMEQKSESNQQNYWMIQYQRLLDAKPLSLRMQEAAVDADLGNLLCKLSAQHYLPIIAHQRITAEALRHMTTKDLRKVRYISFCVLAHRKMQEAGPSTPSAPLQQQLTPPLTPSTPLTPTAPSPDRWSSSECVVCMEHESQVIFLPCGHVCCCQTCSDALQSCPMCRGTVSQRVRLYHG
uniref:Leucine rich repeat and sterile alpha motif containing 1 n=1 Tax=Cyprinus carpio carpio TaxID=630221 RepID=A0A8C1CGL6_CYPCA